MIKAILILIIFFYFLTLIQTSFLLHFNFWWGGWIILISVILINFWFSSKQWEGIGAAFVAGFFWDIFSSGPMGFHIIILVGLAILIKITFKKYVWLPTT